MSELLLRNLATLTEVQPALSARLHWPSEGDHLCQNSSDEWVLTHRGAEFPAALSTAEISAACKALDPDYCGALLVFGLGLGELVTEALARAPGAQIIAWDRDPWVLRQTLCLHDWTAALNADRLRFALNADIGPLVQDGIDGPVIHHPLFSRLYTNELNLLNEGVKQRRALVCCGTLFVDSIADALRAEGYSVLSFDVQRLSEEELDLAVQTWRPALVVGINSVHGLAEFCEARELEYLCWEIDPAMDSPRKLELPAPGTHIYTYRKANVQGYLAAGFTHVEYMPLAADPRRRQPQVLNDSQREQYGSDVSFVGASLMVNLETFKESFQEQCAAWKGMSEEESMRSMQFVVGEQRKNFAEYTLPGLLDQALPGFRTQSQAMGWTDPVLLLAEISAAEKRLSYLAALGKLQLNVWGDEGWSQIGPYGPCYKGPALHETELPLIYNASAINVDIGRLYQNGIVTMRIFDILACGGFVIAEHSADLAQLFEVGVEVESYRTLLELQAKVDHYLAHPEEARAIAERGHAAVLARHTIQSRVRSMLDGLGSAQRDAVA